MEHSIWDQLATKYERLWVQKYSLGPTRERIMHWIERLAVDSQEFTLLDLGCGTGQLLEILSLQYPQATLLGLDKSEGMIAEAMRKQLFVQYEIQDIATFSLKDWIGENTLDFIVCCHSFPYYKNKEQILEEIRTVLKPGGYVLFVHASINSFYDRLAMYIVEKTAEKADYLSSVDFKKMTLSKWRLIDEFTIRERFYMASICGYILRKEEASIDYSTH